MGSMPRSQPRLTQRIDCNQLTPRQRKRPGQNGAGAGGYLVNQAFSDQRGLEHSPG